MVNDRYILSGQLSAGNSQLSPYISGIMAYGQDQVMTVYSIIIFIF